MRINRRFTSVDESPYETMGFTAVSSELRHPDGSVVFHLDRVEVPSAWSQMAADMLAQTFLRKTGVPPALRRIAEEGVPEWLQRRQAVDPKDDKALKGGTAGSETSATQLFDRMAGAWTYWGWKHGYFDTQADARTFFDEIRHMLARQMAAPDTPQWSNTGLHWAYGMEGEPQGHFHVAPATGRITASRNVHEHPHIHACFIQGMQDDVVTDGGIMGLFQREASIFKYGSGSGSNASSLRGAGEPLAGGGEAMGLIHFLKIGDQTAAAIKSTETLGHTARMVVVDADHPDIEAFIDWKMVEEQKAAALVAGSRVTARALRAVMAACSAMAGEERFDVQENTALRQAVIAARQAMVPDTYIERIIQLARQGATDIAFPEYDCDWDSQAYRTVSGQNSSTAVRVTHGFMQAAAEDGPWALRARADGRVTRLLPARQLWDSIGTAAWACAAPGLQFHDTINDWHTCPAGGPIRASSPGGEYMFLDDTACSPAALNLMAFLAEDGSFDIDGLRHAVRLWTMVLDISVLMAQVPSAAMARRTHDYRPLGLGMANLGGLLMALGLAYDSAAGRATAAAISALMTGEAYAVSGEMARHLGAFRAHEANRAAMLRVIANHRHAAYGDISGYEGLTVLPQPLDHKACPLPQLAQAAMQAWDRALAAARTHGLRNAQASAIAPTGTIGLLMDCDTRGIEPESALVKFRKLANGGYVRSINRSVPRALAALGYSPAERDTICRYASGHATLKTAPGINHTSLRELGFTHIHIDAIEEHLATAFDIRFLFNKWLLGEEFCRHVLGFSDAQLDDLSFDMLSALGFSTEAIAAANLHCCGAMTLEGAPGLHPEHLPVFDCTAPCGTLGRRQLSIESHIRMLAAVQPFISGGISRTITLPYGAAITDGLEAAMLAWRLGLKSCILSRDGSKLSQPLASSLLGAMEDEHTAAVAERIVAQEARRAWPRRGGYTRKASVGGHTVYLRTREYDDGRPGGISIDTPGQTPAFSALMNTVATAVSIGLQYGVPLEEFVAAFTATRPKPADLPADLVAPADTPHAASSILAHVVDDLAASYLTDAGDGPRRSGLRLLSGGRAAEGLSIATDESNTAPASHDGRQNPKL